MAEILQVTNTTLGYRENQKSNQKLRFFVPSEEKS